MRIYFKRILHVIKTATHPAPLITFALLFPIDPGQRNGFYFNYLVEGLKDLRFYALTAVAGILVLLYSLVRYKRKNYFQGQVLKSKCTWAWFNTVGLLLITFSFHLFYFLDSTPSFKESIENDFYFISFLVFAFVCRLFLAFNLPFVIVSAMDHDKMKAEYYDDDEYYGGDLNDLDDYLEI